jgi:hypothetical protein
MHEDGADFRDRERAAAVLHFRNELRQVHKDVRMNTRVCKHSWTIITAVYDRKVNLSLTSMVQRVAPRSAAASSKSGKRKKRAQTDDESGTENPQTPRPSKGKKTKVDAML